MPTYRVRMNVVAEIVAPSKEAAERAVKENLGEQFFNIDAEPRPVETITWRVDVKNLQTRGKE